jgi:CheY-like chemotaxis protein
MKEEIRRELLSEVLAATVTGAGPRPGAAAVAAGARSRGRAALVCEDEKGFADSLVETLKSLGWEPEVVPDVEGALQVLERHEYGLVTVDRTLAGDPQGGLKILEWLNRRPGPERRRIFVAYVTDEIRSMDTGSAFIAGANLTVNKNDATRLPVILQKGLEERDELYRVFDEVTDAVARGE